MQFRLNNSEVRDLRLLQETLLSPHAYGSVDEWTLSYLERAKTLLGADKATLRFSIDRQFQQITRDIDQSTMEAYRQYYWKFDFGSRIGGPQVRHRVWSRHRVYGKNLSRFYKSEIYADLVKPARLFDSIGISTLPGNPPQATILYLWHDRQSGRRFGDHGIQLLRAVLPAFQSTVDVALGVGLIGQGVGETIDALSDACALLDGTGRLLHANPSMRALLAATPMLQTAVERRGKVLAERRDPARGARADVLARDELPGFEMHGCYVGRDLPRANAQILVVVKPRRLVETANVSALTARELEVARLMGLRRTNREIAQVLGVSIHTARHHVERVKRKLGARRRYDVAMDG